MLSLRGLAVCSTLLLGAWTSAIGSEVAQDIYLSGRVVNIVDGDTFDMLAQDGVEHRIRPNGFDTPERGRPCFGEGMEALRRLLEGQTVNAHCYKLQPARGKSRARDVCRVTLAENDIGIQMIAAGAAWHSKKWSFEQSQAERRAYAEAEVSAMRGKAGCLWQGF
ncbi:MAG: hypothetical protein B7Y41_06285 [Hydrogenophilales bacterium 28-61-23]|nr:MAG: hypothetical protein B7Y41_06285 [Hydrogenophilales bacterium 28-61-23]